MRVLIVGANGTIGQVLYRYLNGNGWDVLGTYCESARPGLSRFCLETSSLPELLKGDRQWDLAIICAGLTRVDECKKYQEKSQAINVSGTKRLLEQLVKAGIKPVFLSSDYVFSGAKGGYREEDITDPITVYGRQKVEVEQYLLELSSEALVVRLSRVFGADPGDGSLLAGWYADIVAGRLIRCAMDQFFSPTLVDDVAGGLERLLLNGSTGIYHLSGPNRMDRYTLLEAFVDFMCFEHVAVEKCATKEFGFLDKRGGDTSLDPAKFLKETGFRFTSMPEAFAEFGAKLVATSK